MHRPTSNAGNDEPGRHPTAVEAHVVRKRLETANSSLSSHSMDARKEHVLKGVRVHCPDLLKRFELIFDETEVYVVPRAPWLSVRYRARSAVDRLADLG